MDHVRIKSKASQIKRPAIIAAIILALVSGGVMLASIDFSTQRVDRTALSVETVQQGTMEVKVGASGQLLPRHIEQLAAQVSGRVAKADIKPGAVVQAGQVLVELANTQLTASAEEAQSALDGAVAELRSGEADLQTNLLTQQEAYSTTQFNMEKAQVKTEADEALAREGLLSNIELRRSRLDLTALKKTYEIDGNRLKKIRDNIEVQLAVKKSHVTQLARALDRARTQAADLRIVAGISGIVQAITVEVGQQLQPGSPVGRIAQREQLYAELKVAAREATQVQAGQKVVVDTRNGTVNGTVARVDPGVTDGNVVVDVDLDGALPAGARPQLEVEGTIYVSQLPNTLYVGKPSYVKNDADITVYKLDPEGRYAQRVKVKAGKVSLSYMQVLAGLHTGDRIITSEIAQWQDKDRILLK